MGWLETFHNTAFEHDADSRAYFQMFENCSDKGSETQTVGKILSRNKTKHFNEFEQPISYIPGYKIHPHNPKWPPFLWQRSIFKITTIPIVITFQLLSFPETFSFLSKLFI